MRQWYGRRRAVPDTVTVALQNPRQYNFSYFKKFSQESIYNPEKKSSYCGSQD